MTPSELAQFELFKQRMRGIPGYKLATAMNFLNHGIDFRGSSKEMMAEAWAQRNEIRLGRSPLKNITLDMIVEKVEATYPGGKRHMGPHPDPVKVVPKKILTSRELFEQWMTRVRVVADFTRCREQPESYRDQDTDWLWQAWQAGRYS